MAQRYKEFCKNVLNQLFFCTLLIVICNVFYDLFADGIVGVNKKSVKFINDDINKYCQIHFDKLFTVGQLQTSLYGTRLLAIFYLYFFHLLYRQEREYKKLTKIHFFRKKWHLTKINYNSIEQR